MTEPSAGSVTRGNPFLDSYGACWEDSTEEEPRTERQGWLPPCQGGRRAASAAAAGAHRGAGRTSTGLPVHVMQQLRYDVQSKAGGAPFDCATTCQGNDQQKYKAYLREKHTSACYILRGDGAHSIFYDLDLARRECSSSNQQYAENWKRTRDQNRLEPTQR